MIVKLKKIRDNALIPSYQTDGSAGVDLCACLEEPISIKPFEIVAIPTGIAIQLPAGYEAQIRPRSGLALKNGITVLNTPGTIDPDYRGEIMVILINLGKEPFVIKNGMRIAQMVITKFEKVKFDLVEELDETTRNANGFGSTGV